MTPVIAALAGALVVIGLIGMVVSVRPVPIDEPKPARRMTGPPRGRRPLTALRPVTQTLLAVGLAAGLVIAAVSGWVIAIVIVPASLVGIPMLLTAPPSAARIDKLEALEEWTRSLSGKLTAGQSLRSALIKSLQSAPAPIEREVRLMVSRLWNNSASTEEVLRAFAEDLGDSTGDVVVSNLILAATGRGHAGLAGALEALSETVAADVRARRQIEADQAKPRATARAVTVITLAVLALLAFTGNYVEPYGTPLGQAVLIALLGAYVATLVMLRRMAVSRPLPRFLNLEERQARRSGERART